MRDHRDDYRANRRQEFHTHTYGHTPSKLISFHVRIFVHVGGVGARVLSVKQIAPAESTADAGRVIAIRPRARALMTVSAGGIPENLINPTC